MEEERIRCCGEAAAAAVRSIIESREPENFIRFVGAASFVCLPLTYITRLFLTTISSEFFFPFFTLFLCVSELMLHHGSVALLLQRKSGDGICAGVDAT